MERLEAKNLSICVNNRWDPVRLWKFERNDKDIKILEEDIFHYAQKNLAVVNVYIKVIKIKNKTSMIPSARLTVSPVAITILTEKLFERF